MALDYKSSLVRYRRYLQVASEKPLWRASAFVIFSLVLAIVMLVSALRPTMVTISGLLGQIKQQKEIAAKLDKKIFQVQEATRVLESSRDRLQLLSQAVPSTSDWNSFSDRVLIEASRSGVVVNSLGFGVFPVLGKYDLPVDEKRVLPAQTNQVGFSVSVLGQYFNLIQFEEVLENLRRIVVITGVQFNKDEKGELNMTIKGYLGYSL